MPHISAQIKQYLKASVFEHWLLFWEATEWSGLPGFGLAFAFVNKCSQTKNHHHLPSALFGFNLSFSTLEMCKLQYFIAELEKGIKGLEIFVWIVFVKWIVYSFWSCIVVVVINFCFVVLIKICLLQIFWSLTADLQSRINNIFTSFKTPSFLLRLRNRRCRMSIEHSREIGISSKPI